MRWQDGRRSHNVEDRRSSGPQKTITGGIGVLVIVIIGMFFGVEPSTMLHVLNQGRPSSSQERTSQTGRNTTLSTENQLADMVSVVLADTEDVWQAQFAQMHRHYQDPTLVLFTGSVKSACGYAQAATGPFYCAADKKVYIDLGFYRQLRERFNAPGDFAQAYVIAHEVGHHVQNLLGILEKVHQLQTQVSQKRANSLSVRLELQADCLAGVWANHADKTRNILEQGDEEEAVRAASSIGDDTIQQQSRGYVVPDSFTHGTSNQRVHWFTVGLQQGDINQCNTFRKGAL